VRTLIAPFKLFYISAIQVNVDSSMVVARRTATRQALAINEERIHNQPND